MCDCSYHEHVCSAEGCYRDAVEYSIDTRLVYCAEHWKKAAYRDLREVRLCPEGEIVEVGVCVLRGMPIQRKAPDHV